MEFEPRSEHDDSLPRGANDSPSSAPPVEDPSTSPEARTFVDSLKIKTAVYGADAVRQHLRISHPTPWRYLNGYCPITKQQALADALAQLGAAADVGAGSGTVYTPDAADVMPIARTLLGVFRALSASLELARRNGDQEKLREALAEFEGLAATTNATIKGAPAEELPRLYGLLGGTHFVLKQWSACRNAYSRAAALAKLGSERELPYRYELSSRSGSLKMIWLQSRATTNIEEREELREKSQQLIHFVQQLPPPEAAKQDRRQRYAMLLRYSSAHADQAQFDHWVGEALDDRNLPYEDGLSTPCKEQRDANVLAALRTVIASNDEGEMTAAAGWLESAWSAAVRS